MLFHPVIDPLTKIDFYAGSQESFQQLKSLYEALPEQRRGNFYASASVQSDGIQLVRVNFGRNQRLEGIAPIVIAEYRDLYAIFHITDERAFIMLESKYNPNTRGLLKTVSLFLCGDNRAFEFRKLQSSSDVFLYKTTPAAIGKLLEYVQGKQVEVITHVGDKTVGIVYMSWGSKAVDAIKRSVGSLRRLGYMYPVTVVGEIAENSFDESYNIIQWDGMSPFDTTKQKNFQFRAGRVKPFACMLSPYDYSLYIDADTRFVKPIHQSFETLKDYDLILTEEKLTLKDLYNKKFAGWELNLLERDTTIVEIGGDDKQKFINSGVMFFRNNVAVSLLFADWHSEWKRFQEWDEQLALMRALNSHQNLKVMKLPYQWNAPHLKDDTIIFHNYGRGDVRINK